MKKRQTYLKGFTLIELLVTLSLVGVVLLMGNAVFRIFDRMQYQYVGELDDQTEAGVLCAYIRDQVRVAHTYTWQDDTLYLKKRDAQIFAKIYQEDNLTISRRLYQTDTMTYTFAGFQELDPKHFYLIDQAGFSHLFALPAHAQTINTTP